MEYKIMIIEDDQNISQLLKEHLEKFDYCVRICQNFKHIIEEFKSFLPHILLLDINLPSYDGFYWCKKIRTISSCPIIFISARNEDSDQVFAITNGGDDYITKPFSFDIVLAKINSQLRRTYGEYASNSVDEFQFGDCTFSPNKLTLKKDNDIIELSKNEAIVIRYLFEKAPDIVTREELLNEIWDTETFVEENTLNVTISRIRKRLQQLNSSIKIKSIRGLGYRIGAE